MHVQRSVPERSPLESRSWKRLPPGTVETWWALGVFLLWRIATSDVQCLALPSAKGTATILLAQHVTSNFALTCRHQRAKPHALIRLLAIYVLCASLDLNRSDTEKVGDQREQGDQARQACMCKSTAKHDGGAGGVQQRVQGASQVGDGRARF